jgi:hypothetical protein
MHNTTSGLGFFESKRECVAFILAAERPGPTRRVLHHRRHGNTLLVREAIDVGSKHIEQSIAYELTKVAPGWGFVIKRQTDQIPLVASPTHKRLARQPRFAVRRRK